MLPRKPQAHWLLAQYGQNDAPAIARCYHRFANSKDGEIIFEDLRRYAHIYDTTATLGRDGHIDPMQLAIAEGRRQAYLHIAGMLGLTEADLTIESEKTDERSDRREPDTRKPSPRYGDANSVTLDGPEPTASTSASPGTGS